MEGKTKRDSRCSLEAKGGTCLRAHREPIPDLICFVCNCFLMTMSLFGPSRLRDWGCHWTFLSPDYHYKYSLRQCCTLIAGHCPYLQQTASRGEATVKRDKCTCLLKKKNDRNFSWWLKDFHLSDLEQYSVSQHDFQKRKWKPVLEIPEWQLGLFYLFRDLYPIFLPNGVSKQFSIILPFSISSCAHLSKISRRCRPANG